MRLGWGGRVAAPANPHPPCSVLLHEYCDWAGSGGADRAACARGDGAERPFSPAVSPRVPMLPLPPPPRARRAPRASAHVRHSSGMSWGPGDSRRGRNGREGPPKPPLGTPSPSHLLRGRAGRQKERVARRQCTFSAPSRPPLIFFFFRHNQPGRGRGGACCGHVCEDGWGVQGVVPVKTHDFLGAGAGAG